MKIGLFLIPLVLSVSFGNVYAIDNYAVLGDNAMVVVENGIFQEAIIEGHEIRQEDVIRERHYDEDIRVFALTTDGNHAYLIFDEDSIKVKIWTDSGKIFIKTPAEPVSLF